MIDGFDLAWARGYGAPEAGSAEPVTADTLFQAASISKPVAAVGALALVQEGRLSLDADVNGALRSWQVPQNELTSGAPVTLRGLLTHGAGLTVRGFPGYAAGEAVPTLLQVLDGSGPANSAPIRVEAVPGSRYSYSGGGYVVLQQLLEDVAGRPFDELLRQTVLDPIGMAHSTFEQPLPAGYHALAATGHRPDGPPVAGRWHTYPEMAAAGLWTTPGDLALFALELMRAWKGEANRVLSPGMAREMLRRHIGGWGLGLAVEGHGAALHMLHEGWNQGFRALMVAFLEAGQGAVVMTNSDNVDLLWEIAIGIAGVYRWPSLHPEEKVLAAVDPGLYGDYEGRYQPPDEPEATFAVTREGARLLIHDPYRCNTFELYPLSQARYVRLEDGMELEFVRDARGRVGELVIGPDWKVPRVG